MKLSTVYSYAVIGIKAQLIHIEVHIANGLPGLSIVGLPEASVRESKDRVRSAIQNAGFEYPARRITVNLAPADLPKFGAGYDLAIAVGILHASNQVTITNLERYALLGELSLSGQIRAVSGVLPAAIEAQQRHQQLLIPAENTDELTILANEHYRGATSLLEICHHLSAERPIMASDQPPRQQQSLDCGCLSEVQGQQLAKRALEIAAAGGHNLLMQGPPGTGKTMLASRVPGILPPLSIQDSMEVASIYSVAQISQATENAPPFRAPHHTSSPVALVGGGSRPVPGEISLAHKGVLFLDELPEFPSKVLEVMRQPIESGEIWISRANAKVVFPADFQLIAAMNPCPCGYSGEPRCTCTEDRINRYQSRLSGPLLDRIDLHTSLNRTEQRIKSDRTSVEETSDVMKRRVILARCRQQQRQGNLNSQLTAADIQGYFDDHTDLAITAQKAMDSMQLSMRAIHRVLKVALTIADLAATPLEKQHFMEALSYRQISVRRP